MKNISHTEFNIPASQIGHKVHAFELAGLGKAPFKFVGYEYKTFQACYDAPVQVGGSCAYCGQGICHMFNIKSSDSKVFHVGSECVKKTNDKGLMKVVDGIVKAEAKKRAEAKANVRIEAATELLKSDKVQTALRAQPHPTPYRANAYKETLLDYVQYLLKVGGQSGKLNAAHIIERAAL